MRDSVSSLCCLAGKLKRERSRNCFVRANPRQSPQLSRNNPLPLFLSLSLYFSLLSLSPCPFHLSVSAVYLCLSRNLRSEKRVSTLHATTRNRDQPATRDAFLFPVISHIASRMYFFATRKISTEIRFEQFLPKLFRVYFTYIFVIFAKCIFICISFEELQEVYTAII